MARDSKAVKRRPYNTTSRRHEAETRRATIIDVARRQFLAKGYAATTIAAVASEAGVSVETIYKSIGPRPRLAKAVFDDGIAGQGPGTTGDRATQVSLHETDPRKRLRAFGGFVAEVTPRVAPLMLLVRSALDREPDPELATVWNEMNDERLASMTVHAQRLFDDGHLRSGISVEEARDILWTFNAPEMFELLVQRRGWEPKRFGAWVGEMYIAALLPARRTSSGGTSARRS